VSVDSCRNDELDFVHLEWTTWLVLGEITRRNIGRDYRGRTALTVGGAKCYGERIVPEVKAGRRSSINGNIYSGING
jgi:hypothetical protein